MVAALPGWPEEPHNPKAEATRPQNRITSGQTARNLGTEGNPTSLVECYAPGARVVRAVYTGNSTAFLRITVGTTRGNPHAWTVPVPTWGVAVPVGAGLLQVAAFLGVANASDAVSVHVGPGYLAEYVQGVELGPAAAAALQSPPQWAQWVELGGTIAGTVAGAAVPALSRVQLAAQPLVVGTGAGPGSFSVLWHCYE